MFRGWVLHIDNDESVDPLIQWLLNRLAGLPPHWPVVYLAVHRTPFPHPIQRTLLDFAVLQLDVTSAQWRLNDGPASVTLAHHWAVTGRTCVTHRGLYIQCDFTVTPVFSTLCSHCCCCCCCWLVGRVASRLPGLEGSWTRLPGQKGPKSTWCSWSPQNGSKYRLPCTNKNFKFNFWYWRCRWYMFYWINEQNIHCKNIHHIINIYNIVAIFLCKLN